MNEVGGSESGQGLRAIKSTCGRTSDANFEYDDSEWDVGIGNLIIDLDADIEKNNEANRNNNNSSSSAGTTSSGAGSVSSNNLQQMHIPLTSSNSNNKSGKTTGGGSGPLAKSTSNSTTTSSSSSSSDLSTTVMEHSSVVDKGLKMKIKRTKTGTKSGADAKHEIVKNDVVGSSNGTTGGSTSSNSSYSSNKSISDSISSKNSHSSHKEKDKLLIKEGLLHDNSHDNSSNINNATSAKDSEHGGGGGKVKTPRKGSTKEKKTKNNVGNSGNSKRDESNSKTLSNSGSGNSNTGSSGTHAKDNKEFFSTTVNLNVPNVIPNTSSSAFVKTTATIKVPTAPSSGSSVLCSSNSGLHNVHTSSGDSSSSSSRSQNLSGNNSSASSNSSTPWGTASPSKGSDKGRLSPSVANLSNASEKNTGNSYNKKGRAFAAATAAAAAEKSGSTQDENSTGSHGGSSSNASYRNQGALVNSATDLSSSSSNFIQGGSGTQSGNGGSGFGSPKEGGKTGRNTTPATQDVCVGTSVGTLTEPECLGPCEPGTSVTLEGIVWHETESGVLVVNVTWRGKTYVGTLIDCTKNDWAPPRFCDSPASDLEMRTPKNRGKRGRAQTATPVNEPVVADTRSANAKLRNGAKGRRGSNTANTAFVAPASPVKPDPWPKRKTRGSENESQEEVNPKNAKRLKVSKENERKDRRSNSPAGDNEKESKEKSPTSPNLIECPEPNCSKKYTHMNGLRYHLTHAHNNTFNATEDSDSNLSTASTTNASTQPEPPSTSANDTIEPMVVDGPEVTDNSNSSSKNTPTTSIAADEPISAPPTPGKKTNSSTTSTTATTTPSSATSATPKVDDKIYDMSSDADLNPCKDTNQDAPEPYTNKSAKNSAANKPQSQGKDLSSSSSTSSGSNSNSNSNSSDSDSKLVPENLSKDSSSTTSSSSSSSASTTPTTTTPTLTPRTPILTVPVVPSYMSLQNRNLVHGHVVNVPRVEPRDPVDSSCNPMKNSTNQQGQSAPPSKNAPWQPHAQTGLSSHVMNTSPPSQSINVPLNIPMNISEKLGGGAGLKDKDKNGSSPDQASSKKNKHKKKSKEREKERDGKTKERDKQDMANKGLNIPMSGGPSDYSRSSGMFHSSTMGSDRSKEAGDENDSLRKNENREDPQSPAYSDISDANDSGTEAELNVGGSTLKDTSCKGLVIPGEIKKDPIGVPGVSTGAPPYQFFNQHLHSPYLDSLSYAASRQQNKEGVPQIPSGAPEDPDTKNRSGGPIKHPNLPPNSQAPPPTSTVPSGSVPGGPPPPPPEDARRSPKMDFSKYSYPNYFSYPYSGYHPYENNPFTNSLPPSENSFNNPAPGRMFPGMEDREKEGGPGGNSGKGDKSGEKDEIPSNVQIKQEPIEERSRKDNRGQPLPMNMSEDKPMDIKREFAAEHIEPQQKLIPPYMSNSSSKHKEHNKREDRHESRRHHDSKDHDSKSEKSSRNSSSNIDKNKSMEEPEPKERKDEGAKPTMETTGPPPPPTASAYYLPQSYLPSNPFGIPFDPSHPLYRNMLVPGPYAGNPYGIHPGSMPRFSSPGGPTPLPEDLSRPNPPPGNPSKALDLLQHHAAQYYSSHKIHELQERALKSPSPQVAAAQRAERDGPSSGPSPTASSPGGHSLGGPGGIPHSVGGGRSSVGGTNTSGSMPKPADLSKDTKPTIGPGGTLIPGGPNSDNGRTPPPTQHHVHSHTHHHTHVGIGYPIIPTVPPQYSPHYGVLATSPAAPSVIPPFPAQKPN